MRSGLTLGAIAFLGVTSFQMSAQDGRHPIEGAWRLVKAETVQPDGTVSTYSTQESFLLFTDSFYSMNWASGAEPTPYYETRFVPTDSERIARYNALLVNAGRYTVSGDELVIHPEFALVPEFVDGEGGFEWEVSGDTLRLHWVRIVSADGVPDPWTAQGYSYRYTLRRIR